MDRPNILLIMSDQQRWDTLGCYGYPHMITPHLDRLAARGAAFSHAFVQGAVCGPSRSSIVSARYVHAHGVEENQEARGQLDNTLIVFTSDHGECLGDHDMVYKFWCHYDPVVRVPLVFAGPGVRQAGIRDPLVELIDLGPTLLDCAGLDPLPGAQGRSMRSLLEGGTEPLQAVFSQEAPRLMVRTREFKLVFYIDRPYGELYDLEADPGELHNLFDDEAHRETRQSLQERLLRWFTSHRMTR